MVWATVAPGPAAFVVAGLCMAGFGVGVLTMVIPFARLFGTAKRKG